MQPERVNWPDKMGGFKIVQLYVDGEPYMRFGDAHGIHGHILREALDVLGIRYGTMKNRQGYDIPLAKGEKYRASGMGHAYVVPRLKRAALSNNSLDYQIGIDVEHAKRIAVLEPEWTLQFG
ncbi:MAG: hypothetical protein HY516_04230 [Candidatus Aenigmarchaeota archaeon]|nr:hypothetical protein [Candidatus Aenigmarchaeota archaeon]